MTPTDEDASTFKPTPQPPGTYPPFVEDDPAGRERWDASVQVAQQMMGYDVSHPGLAVTRDVARKLYESDVPTHPSAEQEVRPPA